MPMTLLSAAPLAGAISSATSSVPALSACNSATAFKTGAMMQRYSRAVQWTAPQIAARTPGLGLEGYWLDARLSYFLAERLEPSLDRVLAIPCIADRETREVKEVISLEELAHLLGAYSASRIDLLALSSAEFDMPDR